MTDDVQPEHIDASMVDFAVLADWMTEQGLPGGRFERVELVAGGTQNMLIRFRRGGREYVLRRPPRHLRPKSNEALRREARMLAALGGTDVPAPRLIASCPDETRLGGAVFYLMESITGFNPSTTLPDLHAADPTIRHQMGLAAAAGIATLGAVDHLAVGLEDFGHHPEGFLGRQVGRWLSELDSYRALDGYPGADIPGLEPVADWLERNRPVSFRPGIMHGDYHLANLIYSFDGPELAAIVDWEMCTIGDPLLDLGWLLASWPAEEDGSSQVGGPLAAAGGLPTPGELVAHYAQRSDRDLSAITWYAVMACFKLGIIIEGTHARAHAGKAAKEVGDFLHAWALRAFIRAQRFIATGVPD